jgi:hypothetical protein
MPESRKRRFLRSAAIPIGLLAAGALVFAGSQSAFTATTTNDANTWTGGMVMLKNNGAKATATFDVNSTPAAFPATGGGSNLGIKPGDTGAKCIVVENTSSLTGQVRWFVDNVGGATVAPGTAPLSSELLVKVEFAVGQFLNCTGFAAASPTTIFGGASGALLSTAPTTWAGGAGTWAPTGDTTPDYGTYRITWTLPSGATNAVQNGTATADFNWEIQNS